MMQIEPISPRTVGEPGSYVGGVAEAVDDLRGGEAARRWRDRSDESAVDAGAPVAAMIRSPATS